MANLESDQRASSFIKSKTNTLRNLDLTKHNSFDDRIVPFVDCPHDSLKNNTIEEVKSRYFKIIKSLEEINFNCSVKNLKTTISIADQVDYDKCFNSSAWLRYIFQRVLHHENRFVKKFGLLQLLDLDPKLYDDQWLDILIEALNDLHMYQHGNAEDAPDVVRKLTISFIKAAQSGINLSGRFVIAASKISWMSIPLFYLSESLKLSTVESSIGTWAEWEIEALAKLTKKLTYDYHCVIDRETTNNFFKIISHYLKKPVDLNLLGQLPLRVYDDYCTGDNYLSIYVSKKAMNDYITDFCARLLTDDETELDIYNFATMIDRFHSIHRIFDDNADDQSSRNILISVFDVLIAADENPSPNPTISLRVFELMGSLLRVMPPEREGGTWTSRLIAPYCRFLQKFIGKLMHDDYLPATYKESVIYADNIATMQQYEFYLCPDSMIINKLNGDIVEKILSKDQANITEYWYVLTLFVHGCSHFGSNFWKRSGIDGLWRICNRLQKETSQDNFDDCQVISKCYGLIATLLSWHLKPICSFDVKNFLEQLEQLILVWEERVINPSVLILQDILKREYHTFNETHDLITPIVNLIWRHVTLMTSRELVKVDGLKEVVSRNMKKFLLKWTDNQLLAIGLLKDMSFMASLEYLLNDLLLLDIYPKTSEQKMELQTKKYINFIDGFHYSYWGDYWLIDLNLTIRMNVIRSLHHPRFMLQMIPHLTSALRSKKNIIAPRNSKCHRIKLRVIQILLTMPKIFDNVHRTECKKLLCKTISSLILSNNAEERSVRIMQEWFMINVFYYNPKLRDTLWKLLEKGKELRHESITSIASIIYHVAKLLENKEKILFIETAIVELLPCCSYAEFQVRLYCHVVLIKLFDMLSAVNMKSAIKLSQEEEKIKESVQEGLRQNDFVEESVKLMNDFYFSSFHPIEDFDFQTIYYEIPKFFNVAQNELIEPQIFRGQFGSRLRNSCYVFNNRRLGYLKRSRRVSWIEENYYKGDKTLSQRIQYDDKNPRYRMYQ